MQPVPRDVRREVDIGRHDRLIGLMAAGSGDPDTRGYLTRTQIGSAVRAAAKVYDEHDDLLYEIVERIEGLIDLGQCPLCDNVGTIDSEKKDADAEDAPCPSCQEVPE